MENTVGSNAMVYNMYHHAELSDSERYDISAMRYCPNCNTDIIACWQISAWADELMNARKLLSYLMRGEERPSEMRSRCRSFRKEITEFHTMENCPVCGQPLVAEKEYHAVFTHLVRYNPDLTNSSVVGDYCFDKPPKFPLSKPISRVSISNDAYDNMPDCKSYNGIPIKKREYLENGVVLNFFDTTLESKLDFFRAMRKPTVDAAILKEVDQLCRDMDTVIADDPSKKETIVGDKNALTQYIKNLASLEVNIHALVSRITHLYRIRQEGKHFNFAGSLEAKAQLEAAEKQYRNWEKRTANSRIHHEDYIVAVPQPLPLPAEPCLPVLETPGFFNKKKIAELNESKMRIYDAQKAEYHKNVAQYNARLAEIEAANRANAEGEQRYLNDLNNETLHITAMQNEAYEKLQALKKACEAGLVGTITPDMVAHQLVLDEISIAEKTLKDTCDVRNKLYSYGVVFGKYRNLAAMSSFCEYLESGRCSVLEGADGAYNLYESELRGNVIIAQLNQVVESLEEIKENQRLLYSAISETNRQLRSLNETMDHARNELKDIKITTNNMREQLEKVAHNTAVTAYNTQATAYYAKKNAELTNALGYMIALT